MARLIRHRALDADVGMTLDELERFLQDLRECGASGDSVPTFICRMGFSADGMPAKTVTWDQQRKER